MRQARHSKWQPTRAPQTNRHTRDPHAKMRPMHNLRQPANPEGNSATAVQGRSSWTELPRPGSTKRTKGPQKGGSWQPASLQPNRLGPLLLLRQIPAFDQTSRRRGAGQAAGGTTCRKRASSARCVLGRPSPASTDQPACQRAAGLRGWYLLKAVACFQRCRHRPPGFPREPCLATSRGTAVPGTRARGSGRAAKGRREFRSDQSR